MLLKKLIKHHSLDKKKIIISGIESDSRRIKKNYVFFSLDNKKNKQHIKEAIKKGASAIITGSKNNFSSKVPILKVKNIYDLLISSCEKFYHLKPNNIIAVTGTNGKSSVCDFFFQILKNLKIKVATIGTLGIKTNYYKQNLNLTTPDLVTLHQILFKLKKSGFDHVILEASSHGLKQKRLEGIKFNTAIFTSFSQDHLDYHKTMKDYLDSKLSLLEKIKSKKNVIFSNDISINKILNIKTRKLKLNKTLIGYNNANVEIKKITNKYFSQQIHFKYNKKNYSFSVPLIGKFQIQNLLLAASAAHKIGLKYKSIAKVLPKIKEVNGRVQFVRKFPNNIKVFIDYAHTPDALNKTLKALISQFGQKPIVVFGCGGDRDKDKRSKMAKIANKLGKKIYITDDNPRYENPSKIRKLLAKFISPEKRFDIGNRRLAIETAINNAYYNDIILVAGKGHEDYQVYKNKKIPFSDSQIINKLKYKNYNYNKRVFNQTIKKNKIFKVNFKNTIMNSKEVKKGDLFFAIKGKKFDGHFFVKEALKKGANHCVVNRKIVKSPKLIKVYDVMKFMTDLAREKRKVSNAKFIGITGSSGKTTLKMLLSKCLSQYGNTHFSPKSFNNHFGVPFSLSNLKDKNLFSVNELGMSSEGEIKKLSGLIKPDISVITNIGHAHIENFNNIKGIALAKSEIIENTKPQGTLILNKDEKFYNMFKNKAKKFKLKIFSFSSSKQADVCLKKKYFSNNKSFLKIKIGSNKYIIQVSSLNRVIITNTLCILAILTSLGLNLNKITGFIKNLKLTKGRGKLEKVSYFGKKINLIDDSYNANPESFKNSLLNFSNIQTRQKKYLLIGDMLELGKKSKKFHKELSKIINRLNIDKVFIIGNEILETYKNTSTMKRGNILQNLTDFDQVFKTVLNHGDYLLIKGSNANNLGFIVNKLLKGKNVL